jgi:hypothetical protein
MYCTVVERILADEEAGGRTYPVCMGWQGGDTTKHYAM